MRREFEEGGGFKQGKKKRPGNAKTNGKKELTKKPNRVN